MRRFELPTFWVTTRCSNQLSYIHHIFPCIKTEFLIPGQQ
jgi:hypothetical protein